MPSLAPCSRCGTFLCQACMAVADPPLCEACAGRAHDPLGIRSAPFSIGASWSSAWKMFFGAFGTITLLAIVFGIPGGLIAHEWAQLIGVQGGMNLGPRVFDALIGLIGGIGAIWAMAGVAEGRRVTLGGALSHGLRYWAHVFAARLRAGLTIFGFTLLLVIPGVIKALALMLVLPIAVVNPAGDPLGESESLTSGFKGELLGLAFIGVGILLAIIIPTGAVFGILGRLALPLALPGAIGVDILARIAESLFNALFLAAYYGLLRTRELRDA